MDALIAAASRALAAGDPLGALQRVALREDAPALALRGIAIAQLGEHAKARALLQRAARAFGPREALSRARCALAEAEIKLAMRDLAGSPGALAEAAATLARHGDTRNAMHARLLAARGLLLTGRLADAADTLEGVDAQALPPMLAAVAGLAMGELALRTLSSERAEAAFESARQAASQAGIPALIAEVGRARALLDQPAARRISASGDAPLRPAQVEALLASGAWTLDACQRGVAWRGAWIPLGRRPILFALAQSLAQAWPAAAQRDALIARAFRTRHPDETHRARLRVEMGRLRALLRGTAAIEATASGFALRPHDASEAVVLAPPVDGDEAALLALVSDGAAWSTSALALATGSSQRTVQRALAQLEAAGRVRSIGRARAQRWLAPPLAGFTTILLLPASLPGA